jgi:hypothetical protein
VRSAIVDLPVKQSGALPCAEEAGVDRIQLHQSRNCVNPGCDKVALPFRGGVPGCDTRSGSLRDRGKNHGEDDFVDSDVLAAVRSMAWSDIDCTARVSRVKVNATSSAHRVPPPCSSTSSRSVTSQLSGLRAGQRLASSDTMRCLQIGRWQSGIGSGIE